MSVDLNKIRRYERKYLVTPEQADRIRRFLKPYFKLDAFTDEALGGYTINNVYLDTLDLSFYRDTKERRLRRFKPRMRYYGAAPDAGLWLEVKNKLGDIVWKHRRRVDASEWPGVLDARPETRTDVVARFGPQTFEDVVGLYPVVPMLHVRYFREAWVSEIDSYGRVTFDTRLRCRAANLSPQLGPLEHDLDFYDDAITTTAADSMMLLEVKTETLVPWWALAIARNAELWQRGFSKYCYGIEHVHEVPWSFGRTVRLG
jgi:hypothetical protein